VIRNYSGLGWSGDWLEHFQRSLFFLDHFPDSTPVIGGYQLTARPPMMNVLAAFFLGQTRDAFPLFQIIFTALNTLLILPCWLLMPALGLSRRPKIIPLAALLALNPVVIENGTYSWTKSLTVFFVLLAIAFYLAAWRKRDAGRMNFAFVFLSAGLLVHYSAGPYLLLLAVHYIVFLFWKREHRWRELGIIFTTSALLLATWFGWALARYGFRSTAGSNTSVAASARYQGNGVEKVALNLADSIVPFALREWPPFAGAKGVPHNISELRDVAFGIYQVNLIFGMGLIGGPFALWLLYNRLLRRPAQILPEHRFWLVFLPCCVVLGIAVVGERDPNGSAHLTLLPLEALGLTLVAAAFPWKRAVAIAVLAGGLVDFSLGIYLNARIESFENTSRETVFNAALRPADGEFQPGSQTPDMLVKGTAWTNWFDKHRYEIVRLYSHKADEYHPADAAGQATATRLREKLKGELLNDMALFQGWWARHDDSLYYLGDEVAGESGEFAVLPQALMFLLLAGMFWSLIRELRPLVGRSQIPAATRSRPRRRTRGRGAGSG
jgi:hypothetical protein